jgi:hypothetical protein
MPDLRPLSVDLDELASILEGDPMHRGGRVDLETGGVWPTPAVASRTLFCLYAGHAGPQRARGPKRVSLKEFEKRCIAGMVAVPASSG